MIQKDDAPGGVHNKFLGRDGTGHRGLLVAVNDEATEAVMLGGTEEYWGQLVLVREENPAWYPVVDRVIEKVPLGFAIPAFAVRAVAATAPDDEAGESVA